MANEELADTLATEFLVRGYEWKFPEGTRVPTREEILNALEFLKEGTQDGHFQIAGRLVVVNSQGHLDVYLHVGEIE